MKNKGTKEGTAQEIEFVKLLNKKEDLSYWNTLSLDPNNHYAIRVVSKKYAILNDVKVIGSLGVLIKAKEEGYIEQVKPLVEAIIKSEPYVSDKLMLKVLELCRE